MTKNKGSPDTEDLNVLELGDYGFITNLGAGNVYLEQFVKDYQVDHLKYIQPSNYRMGEVLAKILLICETNKDESTKGIREKISRLIIELND